MKLLPFALCLLAAAPAYARETRVGSWSVNPAPDPITGAKRVLVQANSASRPPAFLQVRCFGPRPFVLVGVPRGKFADGDRRWVVLRIGEMPAVVVPMAGVRDTNVLAAGLERDTYQALARAPRAAVRVLETDGSSTDTVYPLNRTAQAFRPVLGLCPADSALDRPAALYDPAKVLPPVPPSPAPAPPA